MKRIQKRLIVLAISLVLGIIYSHFSNLFPSSVPAKPSNNVQGIYSTITPIQYKQTAKVIKVVDGDTIQIDTGQKVRYIGIDTPELHKPATPVQCFAKEAYEKNKELVDGKMIRMEKDVSEVDRYGRLLRYVYLMDTASSEGLFVNDYLVREGYAHAATFPPDVKFSDYFVKLESEARNNNKGLWAACH